MMRSGNFAQRIEELLKLSRIVLFYKYVTAQQHYDEVKLPVWFIRSTLQSPLAEAAALLRLPWK
jgi:hypothetical protein